MSFKLKSKLIVIQCSALIFSLSAVFAATFAWYTASRQTNLTISQISAEDGMQYTLKYFSGNYSSASHKIGYEEDQYADANISYEAPADTTGKYYFNTVTEEDQTPFTISYFSPKHRYSYALEVTSGFAYLSYVRLYLSSFISAASAYDFSQAEQKGIRLAEAINIYGTCFNYSSTTADNDSAVRSFVNGTEVSSISGTGDSPTVTGDLYNRFHFSYNLTDTDGLYNSTQEIATGLLGPSYPTSSSTPKIVFLFTIEFSNNESTFYSSFSKGSPNYWYKDTTGNSNAYQSFISNTADSKGFTLGSMILARENVENINLDAREGTIPATFLDNSASSVTLPTPTKEGYTFNGWYSPDKKQFYQGGATYAKAYPTASSQMAAPVFYAEYTPLSSTVTFDAGTNGTSGVTSASYAYGSIYHSLPVAVGNTGYTFQGWFSAAEGGTQYVEGGKVLLTSDTTFYAHYLAA
ncbi:MAG: InlB B-repeat-containing protein [Bacilli bacterium]|jgi:uncharacterized repeat protein (TIGR02543 family)|nr:InlB B-repeat-containing protein [Bacilli bacterium]